MTDACWLVTGGAGYIGSHVVRSLLASGRRVVVVDDLSTGMPSRLPPDLPVWHGTVADRAFLADVLTSTRPDGVIHLAGKKSPTDSTTDPLRYARENVGGLISLLEAVRGAGVARIVFSSSCSVYGTPDSGRVDESDPKVPLSPYGESKWYGEKLLEAAAKAHGWGAVSLRYFNVVGAATPSMADTGARNLLPLVFQALRAGESPQVFGVDYPTPDGTCIRDYVDVEDVAEAHVRAAEVLEERAMIAAYNIGRGEGSSVFEVLAAVREVTGRDFGHRVMPRRAGDPARVVGRVDRIARELGWTARRGMAETIASAWAAESGGATSASGPRSGLDRS